MLGYLSLDIICSSKLTVFPKLRSRKTVRLSLVYLCKGYSPCILLTLGQRLKFQKTYQNPFYKSFRVLLCKKTALKNTKYSRNESILNISHYAKAIAQAKFSLWVKNYNSKKHVKIHSTNHLQLFCGEIWFTKKNKYLRSESIFKIGPYAKAIARAKS